MLRCGLGVLKSLTSEPPCLSTKYIQTPNPQVADIPDGATVLIGGFSSIGGHPGHLLVALRDHGARNLTIVSNSMGVGTTVTEGG